MTEAAGPIEHLLAETTQEQRRELFRRLRTEFPIHQLERDWNTSAEAILEAIRRSPDLTQRGIRGILAEASFFAEVIPDLVRKGWTDVTPSGGVPYDAELRDGAGSVRVQIKLQRRKSGRPMMGNEVPRRLAFSNEFFVVETQKTRAGKRGGRATRPYRFGEFDILGVSLAPSSKDWTQFTYTVERWLLPDPDVADSIYKFQPVSPRANVDWTGDLLECVAWLRSGKHQRVQTGL